MLLAVNFHYVAERRPEQPRAIFPIEPDELEAQVEGLARDFELLTRDELIRGLEHPESLPERGCAITFDDGLREQYDLALPVLERIGAPAIFYVCGLPLAERRAVDVHKVHRLREDIDEERFAALVDDALRMEGHDVGDVPEDEARSMYRYDSPSAARVKYLLNVALDRPLRERVVERIFDEAWGDEAAFCERLYMSPEQVVELERIGALGSHGYSHAPLSTLGDGELAEDIERGRATLEGVTGVSPRTISYPYGSAQAVDRRVADAATHAGFVLGFTMERASNRTLADRLLLARIDTNDAPGGKSPLFEPGSTPGGRTRYLDETPRRR